MSIQPVLKSHLLLLLITIIAGGNYTVIKTLIPETMSPNAMILLRSACGAVFFYFLEKWAMPTKTVIERKDYLPLFLAGLFGVTLNQFFFYNGMSITKPINGSIFNLINPITIVLFSAFWLKDKLNIYTIIGVVLCLSGALLLLDISNFTVSGSTFWGDLMVFVNAIFFGIYVVLSIPLVRKYNAYVIVKWNFWTAFILLLPLGFTDLIQVNWSAFTEFQWGSLTYVLLLTTLLSYFLNYYLAGFTPASTLALYVYFQPFFAALVAVLLGKDQLTEMKIFCGILIMLGIFIAQKARKPKHELN